MSTSNWWNVSTNNWWDNSNNDNFLSLNNPLINYKEIGMKFLEHYYRNFDQNWRTLYTYYMNDATYTFQDEEYLGIQSIKNKYDSLNLNNPKHHVFSYDVQPIGKNKVSIMVTGSLTNTVRYNWISFGQQTKTFNFVESFLVVNVNCRWFIQSHMFRVV